MSHTLVSLLLLVGVLNVGARFLSLEERIFNGTNARSGQFPYQVLVLTEIIGQNYSASCGGSIVSSTYVVCAAHCFSGFTRNYTTVYMGLTAKSLGYYYVDNVPPSNIIINSRYDPKTFQNDIAIIRLTKAIPFAQFPGIIGIILLPNVTNGVPVGSNATVFDNKRVTASGWGRTNNNASSSPDVLQYQYMNVMPHEDCKSFFAQRSMNITDGQLCTDKTLKPTSGPCQGDSGGPLALNVTTPARTIDTYLLGATSFIYGPKVGNTTDVACLNSNPAVYTSIAYFLPWIYANTGLNGTKG